MLETLSEIHSCISLIEQAAGQQFNLPVEVGDLTFQLCNMGGELVSVEGVSDSLGQPVDPILYDLLAVVDMLQKVGSASST